MKSKQTRFTTAFKNPFGASGTVFCVLCLGVLEVQAATWLSTGTTDWNTAGNWNPSGVPNGQAAIINTITGSIATITVNISATPSDILIGDGSGQSGRLDHIAGTASSGNGNWVKVGNNGGTGVYNLANTSVTGTGISGFAQGSGKLTVGSGGQLRVGGGDNGTGNTGTFNMNTTESVSATQIHIGATSGSTGRFNLESGTISTGDIYVGENNAGGSGRFDIAGGTVTSTSWVKIGHDGGNGAINLANTAGTGGTLTGFAKGTGSMSMNGAFRVGGGDAGSGGTGTFNMNTSGTLTVDYEFHVGTQASTGVMNLDNGAITSNNAFYIGNGTSAIGTVSIAGGSLTTTNAGNVFVVGNGGTGTLNQTAGTISSASQSWVGNGSTGSYNMSGGTFTSASWFVVGRNSGSNGTLTMSGGKIDKTAAGSDFVVAGGTSSTGTVLLSGGLIDATGVAASIGKDGTGVLTVSASGEIRANTMIVGEMSTGTGTVNLNTGGIITVNAINGGLGGVGTANLNFNGGTLKARQDNAAFVQNMDTASVLDGGVIVDTNGFNVSFDQGFSQGGSGIGVISKINTGTLTLAGSTDNSGTRARVDAGTLVLGKASSSGPDVHSVGTSGGAVALLITGGTAQLGATGGDQIYSKSAVNMTGGTFDLAGLSEGFDGLSGSAGIITNSTVATTSTLTLGQDNSSGSPSFAGVIQNTGTGLVALVKTGSGTQALTGPNTYSGGTSITGGTISIGHNTALGSGSVAMSTGTTLTNTAALTVGNAFALTGSVAITGNNNLTLNGTISSGGGPVTVTKTGASVLTLTADNRTSLGDATTWNVTGGAYNSSTGLYDNVIAISTGQALGGSTGNVLNLNGGTLRFTANGGAGYASPRAINVQSGGGAIDDGGFAPGEATTPGSNFVNPNVTITGSATLSLVSSNNLVLSGVLSGTNGAVAKFGSGTAVLSGANNYTGITFVNDGTLVVNGNQGGAAGDVNVASIAKLMGAGTIGGATTVSGTLSGGNAAGSIGTLNLSSTLNFSTGSIFEWDIANTGATYDKALAGGLVSGLGAVFNVVLNGGGGFADPFWDSNRNWTATDLFGATSASVNLADIFSGSNTSFATNPSQGSFSFTSTGGGTNNQLTWSAVPEPTSAFAGLLIAAGLLRRRRDRREISASAH